MMREEVSHTHILRILQTINLQSAVYSFAVEEKTAVLICDFVMITYSTFQPSHGQVVEFEGLMVKGQPHKLKNTYTQPAVGT